MVSIDLKYYDSHSHTNTISLVSINKEMEKKANCNNIFLKYNKYYTF